MFFFGLKDLLPAVRACQMDVYVVCDWRWCRGRSGCRGWGGGQVSGIKLEFAYEFAMRSVEFYISGFIFPQQPLRGWFGGFPDLR